MCVARTKSTQKASKYKIRDNEHEASTLSEMTIYCEFPQLRKHSFAHEIFVDSFLFAEGFGRDRIADFDADREVLDFSQHIGVGGIADLAIVQTVAGAVITDGAGGRLLLVRVDRGDIDESDFLF